MIVSHFVFRFSVLFLCLTLTSCSQLLVRHRVDLIEERLRGDGQDVLSFVGVNKGIDGDPIITSRASWLGSEPKSIKEAEFYRLLEGKWGRHEVTMFTAGWITDVIDYYDSDRDLINLGFAYAERAFLEIEPWFANLRDPKFHFLFLMSDPEHGLSYQAESRLDDPVIRMVVTPKPLISSQDLAGTFLASIAHELTHLNQQVVDIRNREKKSGDWKSRTINREAAAHIVEGCAFELFLRKKLGDDFQPLVPDLEQDWITEAFPGLMSGRFDPSREEILGMSASEQPYRKVAYAVYSLFAQDPAFESRKSEVLKPLLSYCETIANQAPDFMSGQLCPEGTSRMPGKVPACEPEHGFMQSQKSTE